MAMLSAVTGKGCSFESGFGRPKKAVTVKDSIVPLWREVQARAVGKGVAKARVQRLWLAVLADCRKADKRHGSQNDLDLELVRETLAKGCTCTAVSGASVSPGIGWTTIQGHSKANVLPACMRGATTCVVRCLTRPGCILSFLRFVEAKDLGLFWGLAVTSTPFNRRHIVSPETLLEPPGEAWAPRRLQDPSRASLKKDSLRRRRSSPNGPSLLSEEGRGETRQQPCNCLEISVHSGIAQLVVAADC